MCERFAQHSSISSYVKKDTHTHHTTKCYRKRICLVVTLEKRALHTSHLGIFLSGRTGERPPRQTTSPIHCMSAELDAGDRPRLLSDGDVSGKRRPWMLGYGASGGLVLGFILGIVIGIVIGSMPPITQRCHQTVAMATRHDASPTARPLLPSSPPPPSPPLSSSPPPRSHAVPAPARALPPIHTDPEQRLERCKQDLLVSRAQAEDKRPPSPPPPLPSPAPLLLPSCTVWGICELHFEIEPTTQPFETELHATLESYDDPTQRLRVRGFYDGGGIYRARLSPPIAGRWRWSTSSSAAGLDGRTGEIMVSEDLEPGVLPPVHADGRVFRHADGREHFSVGTTAYAWIHQSDELLEQRPSRRSKARGRHSTSCG